jgi:hypothetical protein
MNYTLEEEQKRAVVEHLNLFFPCFLVEAEHQKYQCRWV